MKAIVRTEYGPPDVLQLKEVDKPVPKDNEARVKVVATSLNAADLEMLRGDPVVRISAPRSPAHVILGSDIAGRIEAVGRDVKRFKLGDEIWGDLSMHGYGTFAEYRCVPERALRLKPASMTFEEAAATPSAGVVAIQNLRGSRPSSPSLFLSSEGKIRQGQKVLINGAGGGVGTFAVQIAKSYGAEVTAVDSAMKSDMLHSIGADHVIDYKKMDFTETGQRYDLILDIVARRSIFACRRALSPGGVFVMVGGSTAVIIQSMFLGPLISMTGRRMAGVVAWRPNRREDLDALSQLFEAGRVRPVVERVYPLNELPDAMLHLKEGRALGKLVITMDSRDKD